MPAVNNNIQYRKWLQKTLSIFQIRNPTPYSTFDNTNRCNLWAYFLQNTVVKTDDKCAPNKKRSEINWFYQHCSINTCRETYTILLLLIRCFYQPTFMLILLIRPAVQVSKISIVDSCPYDKMPKGVKSQISGKIMRGNIDSNPLLT